MSHVSYRAALPRKTLSHGPVLSGPRINLITKFVDCIGVLPRAVERSEWALFTDSKPLPEFVILDATTHLEYPAAPGLLVERRGRDGEEVANAKWLVGSIRVHAVYGYDKPKRAILIDNVE
jgi:hypothetical protein